MKKCAFQITAKVMFLSQKTGKQDDLLSKLSFIVNPWLLKACWLR